MTLLDTNGIQNIFGAVFGGVYGSGQLIRINMVRQTGGTILPVEDSPVAIKVQRDNADETMRNEAGYTSTDMKLIVLQAGISGRQPNSDDVIVQGGIRWKIASVREDPARTHWIIRGQRQGNA